MTVFGTTTVGGSSENLWTSDSFRFGEVFTAPKSGYLAAVWMYLSSAGVAGTMAPVVYNATSSTAPTSLVGSGAATTIAAGQAAGWVRMPITNGGQVVKGNLYLIGGFINPTDAVNSVVTVNTGVGTRNYCQDTGGAYPTPQSTWSAGTGAGNVGSIGTSMFAEIVDTPQQSIRGRLFRLPGRRRSTVTRPVASTPSWVQQTQRDRLTPPQPRRRRTASPIPPGAPVVTTQALPPQQTAAVRHGWLPRRRARGTNYVPAQVITVQALPPQPARRRTLPFPRRRVFAAVTVTVSAQAVTLTVPQQPAAVRHGWLPRAKRRTAQPPFTATATVTTQALPPQQPAAVRHGWLPRRRARGTNYVPAQVVVVTTQALPPQTGRDRLTPQPRRKAFTTGLLPTVRVTIPTVEVRRRVFLPARRGHAASPPVTVTVTLPPQPAVRARRGWLKRRRAQTGQFPMVSTTTVTIPTGTVTSTTPTTATVGSTQPVGPSVTSNAGTIASVSSTQPVGPSVTSMTPSQSTVTKT